MSAALELEIERMWLRLANVRQRPMAVFLTATGRLIDQQHASVRARDAAEVGRYNQRITLADFRDDVFHVWESMRR